MDLYSQLVWWICIICSHSVYFSISHNVLVQPPQYDHGLGLPTTRPLNIAHRGSSGVLPEHTIESLQKAIDDGSDMIEVDLAITSDLELVCMHEAWMSPTTNAEDIFPEDRMNTYRIDGISRTDFFTVDFTLEELTALRINQRFDYRDTNYDSEYGMASLKDLITLVQNANSTVGLLIELKDSNWVNSLDVIQNANTTFEELTVNLLAEYGYVDSTHPVLLESFEEESIIRVSEISDLAVSYVTAGPLSDERLQELSEYCYGIVISKPQVIQVNVNNQRVGVTDLVERARALGLKVHVWTLRNEDRHLLWDYSQDAYLEYDDFVMNALVDGLLTDFPGTCNRYLGQLYEE